ncbi:MAG: type II toxin-antitoxin system Phd/YefM family antitoxin [Phycisphaerales bacterium]
MKFTNIHDAKTHFSRLVDRAIRGEEVIIAKAGKPVAKLVKWRSPRKMRRGGQWRGQVWISEDFDGPLPPDIQDAFEGRGE